MYKLRDNMQERNDPNETFQVQQYLITKQQRLGKTYPLVMTEERKTFCKISSRYRDYYLLTERTVSDDLKLALSDGADVWNGSLSGTDMAAGWSQSLKMDNVDFASETMKALTCNNVDSRQFEYLVTPVDNSCDVTFVWKKCVPQQSIKFQLGHVRLVKADRRAAMFRQIFDCIQMTELDLRQQISALQCEKERLASERTRALQSLEKCVTAKEELEKDMFSKFLVVINDKKAKIRELTEEVVTLQTRCEASTSNISSPPSSKRPDNLGDGTETDSVPASDSEYDTDEEKKETKRACPSKITKRKCDSADSSLILDNGEPDELPSLSTRRFDGGRPKRGRKCVPSKPTLPKVKTSNKEAAATPETTKVPLYKVPSRRRRKSSQSTLDVNDLMADL